MSAPPRIPRPRTCFRYRLPCFPPFTICRRTARSAPVGPFRAVGAPLGGKRPRQMPNAPNRGIWRENSGIRPPLAAALDTRAPRAAHGRDTAGGACIHDPMRTSGAAGSRHGVRRPANTPIWPHQRPPRAYFRLGGYRGPGAGWWPATPPQKDPRRGLHAPQRHPF